MGWRVHAGQVGKVDFSGRGQGSQGQWTEIGVGFGGGFSGEAADCDVFVADGVKESGFGREAKGAGGIAGGKCVEGKETISRRL
jgi:hypothetical protein